MMRHLLFLALAVLAGCVDSGAAPVPAAVLNPQQVRADDTVTLDDAAYGCTTQDRYAEALFRDLRQEKTAWGLIVTDASACFFAKLREPGETWRVVLVDQALMQIRSADGSRMYWTSVHWGRRAA